RAIRPSSHAELAAMRLPELQALAAERGITGASKLRKGDLVDAINENQNTPADGAASAAAPAKRAPRRATATAGVVTTTVQPTQESASTAAPASTAPAKTDAPAGADAPTSTNAPASTDAPAADAAAAPKRTRKAAPKK